MYFSISTPMKAEKVKAMIREKFIDPLCHFARNCASSSCPNVPRVPFYPDRLDQRLDLATLPTRYLTYDWGLNDQRGGPSETTN